MCVKGVCVSLPALLLLLLLLLLPGGHSCPRSCNCYQTSEVHCTFRSLLTIPAGLPAHTRRINLGFNSINRLHDKSLLGLKKVELLMLHSNNLHHVPDAVFRDMKSLQILKLSYNKLREISSLTFSGLNSLQRLYLDHNLLQHIHPRALLQLPRLRLLRLQGNRLHQLHPHSLCTLSLLNTYYFSTLRNLDLSNNSLTSIPKDILSTAPLLETIVLQSNPWNCDCRMNWLSEWSLAHPGLLKCPGGLQCPVCASPSSLQGQGVLEHPSLLCTSPVTLLPGKETIPENELSEIQSKETFREPLGSASIGFSDEQGNSVSLSCNVTHSISSRDIAPPPELTQAFLSPLTLTVLLTLECPVERQSYEKLWRILAYYSETAVRLEREIMLSKAPESAYRYRQRTEAEGYYHTGVKAYVKVTPQWLLQPSISIQLNRAESNGNKVYLIYSTSISTSPDPIIQTSTSAPPPWVIILTNHTTTTMAAISGSKVELPCPILSSGNPKVQWFLPDGSRLTSSNQESGFRASALGLHLNKLQLSDSGIYYCVAWAGGDMDVLPVRLAVEDSSVPLSGEKLGLPVKGPVGQQLSLPCKASGSPEPDKNWILPDGNVIRHGVAVSGGLTIDSNGTLFLPSPSFRDAGHYRCIAINQYGSDSLSLQLILTSEQFPPLRSSYPRGPQSAAGRSTKIRAPLFHQGDEGSGTEEKEEVERNVVGNRSPHFQRNSNRRFSAGNPQRRFPGREGLPRRVGGPVSTEQRRIRFDQRNRIDPQKWADILAKIRQKTAPTPYGQSITTSTTTTTTAEPVKAGDREPEKNGDMAEDRSYYSVVETTPEGSIVDNIALKEEELQPIQPVHPQRKTTAKAKTNIQMVKEKSEAIEINKEKEEIILTSTKINSGTDSTANPVIQKEHTLPSATNEISPETDEVQQGKTTAPESQPSNPRQGLFPNLVPNSRPQNPWNSRRKIGQRRRIINRPRGRPLPSPQPLPNPLNPRSQNVTPDTTTYQMNRLVVPTISLAPKSRTHPSANSEKSLTVSDTLRIISKSVSSSSPFFPSHTNIDPHVGTMTQSGKKLDTEEFTNFNTPEPTGSLSVSSETHVQATHSGTVTHGIQTHTETQTISGKHVARPWATHSEEIQRSFLDVPYDSHSSNTQSVIASAPATAEIMTSPAASDADDIRSTTLATSDNTPQMTISPITTAVNKLTTISNPPFSNILNHSPTTTTTTIPFDISSSSVTTFSSSPKNHEFRITTKTPTTSITRATTKGTTVSDKTHTSIITEATTSSTTATTQTNTSGSFKDGPRTSPADPRKGIVSGVSNQSRPPLDWKNPGANWIPDSHRSRSSWPPFSSIPVTPVAPVVRSRPQIADPHIRTISFPADSTARLSCEAEGEPKPSITWTKVATGAVMSVHSRAQHFEVLPNGTLVIHNIQQQDRGTYICSAQSFMGRDRLLTTLEVWTRPPRMQLPSYREFTIHQGGEVRLECQADGVPAPLLSWVLPDRSVLTSKTSTTNRIHMHTNGTLNIAVTLPTDRGVYRCVASNVAGAASSSVRIHVSSLPPVLQQPKEQQLLLSLGMPFYAHCSARGAPPPALRWKIPDGTTVRPSQFLHGNLFVLPNGTLHIRKVGPKDRGTYECAATNAVGANKRTVKVEIKDLEAERGGHKGPETLKNKSQSPSISVNRDRALNISSPIGSVKFSPLFTPDKSKTLISSSSPSFPRPIQPSSSSPKVNKTVTATPALFTNFKRTNPSSGSTLPTNNTKVSINTHNTTAPPPFPADRRPTPVRPLPISPFTKAIIISSSPSVSIVHYGSNLDLHCSVTGKPTPIIIWRTPNKKLVNMHLSFDHRMKVLPNGTLTIHKVTEKDAGDYLCIARNKVSDDYRLLRISVETKPAKIEPKQPDQMVSYGKPLKVDCQASGQPDPEVHWSLPDGTTVNSVLHGEDRKGRARRLTVFDNGTLLLPAVGMGEEGEYTCYAENQGGQDSMKVKVKVMRTSSPSFTDSKSYRVIKVPLGATAKIACQAIGDPVPTVTWFSPANRVIPYSSKSSYYFQRIVVVPGGILELRTVQNIDTGNYTCRASNSAGERMLVVRLEVDDSRQRGQERWDEESSNNDPTSGNVNPANVIPNGFTKVVTDHLINNNSKSSNNSHIRNSLPNKSVNSLISGSNYVLWGDVQDGLNRPVSRIPIHAGNSVINVGVSRAQNIGFKADKTGVNRNEQASVGNVSNGTNTHNRVKEYAVGWTTRTNSNQVPAGQGGGSSTSVSNSGGFSTSVSTSGGSSTSVSSSGGFSTSVSNSGGFSTSVSNSGGFSTSVSNSGRTSKFRGNGVIGGSNQGSTNTAVRNGDSSSNNTGVDVVTTVKQQAVKGQAVLLPCRARTPAPSRLAWFLPGNGMLPAPYYGSRFTVFRNGSLELRGVRASDAGTLVCVAKRERDEVMIRVELEVLERHAEVQLPGSKLANGDSSIQSKPASPVNFHSRITVTEKPLQKNPSVPTQSRPVAPPPLTKPVLQPTVTRTAPLVSIINGETLHLPCSGNTKGSLSWTMPGGKVLSRGEAGHPGHYTVQEDGTLLVHQASVFDRGSYTCRFTSFDSTSVSVITVPVIVIAYPPRITTGPSPVTYTRPGFAVELPCLTIATPRATVTWETPDLTQLKVMGQPRIYGNRYLSPQGSLVIQNPTGRDTGFYRCTAKNVIGVDTKATYLHVM
ncbi:matrix-remodeling-associated protein 5-like [Gouania willdenowi]|uniref:matrix-remodeling-associated protein 5-like n=1 Tax=Gouania willdenowi TaxID=441366 RepID=UPI001055DB6A|nr:matrix-remodeling-associated protein 5-like [Gouania willdenowi]